MCQIFLRDPKVDIGYERFKNSVLNNKDGYGYCFPDGNGKLHTLRSAKSADPDTLWRIINEELKDESVMLHLRFTTAGETTMRNAHPFPVLDRKNDGIDLRMAHNGTITKYKPAYKSNDSSSDTRRFVADYVRPLFKRLVKAYDTEAILGDPFIQKLLADQIPSSSTLCFVDGLGNKMIVNERGNGGKIEESDAGKLWYSNTYSFNPAHREPKRSFTTVATSTTTTGKTGGSTSNSVIPMATFSDVRQRKFTTTHSIEEDDLLSLRDDTINELMTKGTLEDKATLVKELIFLVSKEKRVTRMLKNKVQELEKKNVNH